MKPFRKQWEKCACGCPLNVGGEGETKYYYCPKCEPELKGKLNQLSRILELKVKIEYGKSN